MKRTIIVPDDTLWFKGVTTELKSPTRGDLTYTPGTTVRADSLEVDPSVDCAPGIFFCRSLPEALRWARCGKVVSVRPIGLIIDTGSKLRAKSVEVVAVVPLYDAYLYRASLSGASLSDADLSGANLAGADLAGANLSRANLSRANLAGASLAGANLSGATLSRTNLSGANLSGASLAEANLYDANLYRANLAGANLTRTDLSRANHADKAYNVPKGAI